MQQRKEIGVGKLALSGRQAALAIARSGPAGGNLAVARPSDTPLELYEPQTYAAAATSAEQLLSELYPDPGPFTGVKPAGIAGTSEQAWINEQQQWPEARRAGLSYGELSSILAFLRNYGIPRYTLKAERNEAYESPIEALRSLMGRWNALDLAHKDEFAQAYSLHVSMYGWSASKGLPKTSDPMAQQAVNWPCEPRKLIVHSGSTMSKLAGIGPDRWQRYVAAMAISRDLFAEEMEQVGGVKPGLVDKITDTRLEGVAVTGNWVNLAGVWRWKGFDVDGVPLTSSTPLFAKPLWDPSQAESAARANEKIMRWLLGNASVRATFDKMAPAQISRLAEVYNRRARYVHGAVSMAGTASATGVAFGGLLVKYFALIGLDMRAMFGASWPQVEALIEGKTPPPAGATTGVSGMNAFAKLARTRGVSGAADAVAAVTPTGGTGPSGADYLSASVGWAKALTDLGLGIYATQVAKQSASQQAELQKQAQKQAQQAAPQPVNYAPAVQQAEPVISTTVLALLGVAAVALAMRKR